MKDFQVQVRLRFSETPIGTINKIHKINTAAIAVLAFEAVKSTMLFKLSDTLSEQRESVKIF